MFVAAMAILQPMPSWSTELGLVSSRQALIWAYGQPVIEMGVVCSLAFVLVESGAYQMIISTSMACALGLPITPDTNCGKYSVAGGTLLPYAGYVSGVVDLQFGEGVALHISGLRLAANDHPLFLLGKDVL